MSETGFRFFNGVFVIGAELLYGLYLALFLRPFLTEREQKRKKRKQFFVFAGYFLTGLFCDRAAVPPGAFGLILTALLTGLSGFLGLEKGAAFLLSLLYWNAKISSGLMVESLYFIVQQSQLFSEELLELEAVYLRAAALVTGFLLFHAVLLAVMLYALRRQMMKRRFPFYRRELCYLGLVPAAGILFGQIISQLLIEIKDGVLYRLYERHPAFLAAVPLLALLFYAGAYLTIAFQQGMAALREEQAAWFAERQQTQILRARIHEAEQLYARVRGLKHEMRGHLTNIKGLARNGEYASLEKYIAQIDGSIRDFDVTIQTGNPVTDVIVNDVRRRCAALGVRFQTDFYYPANGGYDAFDVGIILQNLLQNALDACEKMAGMAEISETGENERFITLAGKRKGRFFLIEVKNSFTGKVVFRPDGLPLTAKTEDAPMHGIGLSNVRREAEKYMGELELNADRREFSAAVLLQEFQERSEI